ncbi:MAG: hypothetical protein ACFE96_06365, partial [Candidatus Hermodarchaeota archaeon]
MDKKRIKINHLKSDLEDQISNLEDKIDENTLQSRILELLQDLSYPFGLREFLDTHVRIRFHTENLKLNIGSLEELINFNFKNQVKVRKYIDDRLSTIPVKANYTNDFYLGTSLKFRSGKEYLEYASTASWYIKPVLIYYAVNHIYSGLIDCVLKFKFRKTHGLKTNFKKDPWLIIIEKDGFFIKLVITIELLSIRSPVGMRKEYLSYFTHFYVDYNDQEMTEVTKRYGHLNLCGKEIDLKQLNEQYEDSIYSKGLYWEKNVFFLHYLNLFAFCSLSRYNPIFWYNFLKGEDYMYKVMQRTYRNLYV